MHGAAHTRQDHEAAMHGDAGAKGGREKEKRGREGKKKKKEKIGRCKPAPEVGYLP